MKKFKINLHIIKFPQLSLRTKKGRILSVGILLTIVLCIGVLIFHIASDDKNEQISKKVDSLNQPDVTCDRVVDELGSESPEAYDEESRKKLLEIQLNCFSDQGMNNKALNAAEELKNLYNEENQKEDAQMTQKAIDDLKSAQAVAEEDDKHNVSQPVE